MNEGSDSPSILQYDPGVHGVHSVTLCSPVLAPNVPAGQLVFTLEPSGQ